jgi:hypothetical protein
MAAPGTASPKKAEPTRLSFNSLLIVDHPRVVSIENYLASLTWIAYNTVMLLERSSNQNSGAEIEI